MRRTTPLRRLVLFAALLTLAAAPSIASARAWLGVYTQEVTDELREALDLPKDGVLVSNVVTGSPAERAGIRKGDVITQVDNRAVSSPDDLSDMVGEKKTGDSVSLSIKRKGSNLTLAVRLTDRPKGEDVDDMTPTPPAAPKAPRAPHEMRWYSSNGDVDPDEISQRIHDSLGDLHIEKIGPGSNMVISGLGRGRLGVRIETLSDELAEAIGAPGAKGVFIVEVLDNTAAEKAGLKAGDVITTVDGTTVTDTDDLSRALRDKEGKVSLSIVRRGEKRTVTAELEESRHVIRLRDGGFNWKSGDEGDAALRKEVDELRKQVEQLSEELKKSQKPQTTQKSQTTQKPKK